MKKVKIPCADETVFKSVPKVPNFNVYITYENISSQK